MLEDKEQQTKKLEGEIAILQSHLLQLRLEADEVSYIKSVKEPQLFGFYELRCFIKWQPLLRYILLPSHGFQCEEPLISWILTN